MKQTFPHLIVAKLQKQIRMKDLKMVMPIPSFRGQDCDS
jgi:hypothetical protein